MLVYAVIISYCPDVDQLATLFNALVPQVDGIILVDNTPSSAGLSDLSSFDAHVVQNGENYGIAAAQNQGIKAAFRSGAEYIVLFDQDSIPDDNFVASLLRQHKECSRSFGRGVVIGPSVYCEFEQRYHEPFLKGARNAQPVGTSAEIGQLISSGMLFGKETFKKVGPLNEKLFIDAVDHEWCWRAAHFGVPILKSSNVTLFHRLGEGRHKVFGIWTKVTSPHRLYYQMRNTIWLLPVSYVPIYWKVRNLVAIPVKALLLLIFHTEKKRRFKYFFKGLWDGVFKFTKVGAE